MVFTKSFFVTTKLRRFQNRVVHYFPKIFAPKMSTRMKSTKKIKNNILAIEAAPAAIPVKPKIAATIAIIKKIAAHFSITQSLKVK